MWRSAASQGSGPSLARLKTNGKAATGVSSPFKQGPRIWLCQSAGAAPLGGRELHEVSERKGFYK